MKTLKELRVEKRLKQKELAELLGVTDRTIQNYEKDSSNIGDILLSKYMKVFNVKYDDIFLGTEYEIFEFENGKKRDFMESAKSKLINV